MLLLQMPHHVVSSRGTARAARPIAVVRPLGLVGGLVPLEVAELIEATRITAFAVDASFDDALVREGVSLPVFAVWGEDFVSLAISSSRAANISG